MLSGLKFVINMYHFQIATANRLQNFKLYSMKSFLWLCAFCFISFSVFSQGLGKSPYSYYGIGELTDPGYATYQQMGGAGVSYANGLNINSLNPALLARNKYTTYDVGAHGQYKKLIEGSTYQRDFGANINYLSIALPVAKKWTTSLQYMPYSYTDYQVSSYKFIPTTSTYATYTYKGSGGINRIAWSNGVQAGKNLFVGLEVNYLFGGIDRESISQLTMGDGQDYQATLLDRTNHGDFKFKAGVAYRKKLSTNWYMSVGGTYDFGKNFSAVRNRMLELKSNGVAINVNPPDTISRSETGTIYLPSAYRLGFTLESPYKFAFTVDYSQQQWSQYKDLSGANGLMQDTKTIALGMEYIPNFSTVKGYHKLMAYRLGFNRTESPYSVNNQRIIDQSFTFGLGLPMGQNRLSSANVGVAIGQRGINTPIQENYVKFSVGFSLLDSWFVKYKID
jgi:hypothetical protein